jgi:hypothetical protein
VQETLQTGNLAIRWANCSVPSTFTFQMSGLLPKEATAQLST